MEEKAYGESIFAVVDRYWESPEGKQWMEAFETCTGENPVLGNKRVYAWINGEFMESHGGELLEKFCENCGAERTWHRLEGENFDSKTGLKFYWENLACPKMNILGKSHNWTRFVRKVFKAE